MPKRHKESRRCCAEVELRLMNLQAVFRKRASTSGVLKVFDLSWPDRNAGVPSATSKTRSMLD